MKTIKKAIALVCAILFLAPAILIGIPTTNVPLPPSLDAEISSPDVTPETPPVEQPPEPETPPQVQPPTEQPPQVQPPEPETPPTPIVNYANYIKVTGNNVNLRAGAGTNYSSLGQAEEGTRYALIEKVGNWYKTYYRNQTAYIYANYTTSFTIEQITNKKAEAVIKEGYKLLGVPYIYGATRLHDGKGNKLKGFSTQKFDCSSLMQYIFYQGAGKLLDVTTRTQIKQGKYVAPSDLQRGDCIFFTNESRQHLSGIERVGHVALYLGNNYILHTASDFARIEKISATRWSYYIETRRFV